MTSKILDPRALPLQTTLFIFALAYFYSGISLSPGVASSLKLLFGGLFFVGLVVSHLILVQETRIPSLKSLVFGITTLLVVSLFFLTGVGFFLLLPVPALSARKHIGPAEATILHLRSIKGALLASLARRILFHAGLLLGFLAFFGACLLVLAHGDPKSAFLAILRPSMIHEFIALLYCILLLPPYTHFVQKILRNS